MAFSGGKIRKMIKDTQTQITAEFFARLVLAREGHQDSGKKGLMPDLATRTSQTYLHHLHRDAHRDLTAPFCPQGTFLHVDSDDSVQIGRSSFDLRLGRVVAWCNEVREGLTEQDLMNMSNKVLDKGEKFEFKANPGRDRVYYTTSSERVHHSSDLEVEVHAKSTTGRVGCQSRGVGRTREGEIITILQPLAFNLIGACGKTSFVQAVVRYGGTPFMTREQALEQKVVGIKDSEALDKALTPMGLRIRFDTKLAYRARKTREAIDMEARGLDWRKWYDLIEGDSGLVLDKKTLYLLGSLGIISLNGACGIISKEQRAFTGLGGFGCLAGVIQDGFTGQITMEPYFNTRTRIESGSLAGYVLIDKIEGDIPKGQESSYGGEYQNQKAPRLPKMFKIS